MRPLSPDGDGAVNNDPRPFLRLVNAVDNLVDGLRRNQNMVIRTICFSDARIEQTQVIIYFGHGPDCGPRILACGFLVNRYRRRQSLDRIDVGLFDPTQKLAGICGKAFHISSPSFRIYRIKGKGCFSASGKPGHHDQFFLGDFDVNVF